MQHPHLFTFELHRFAHKIGCGVQPLFQGQVHHPNDFVDCQAQNRMASFLAATQYHRRVMASLREVSLYQSVKVDHRQRIAAILSETNKMGS